MSRLSQVFSFARTNHPFRKWLIVFGTWTWHAIGWIWSTIIIGGLLVSLLLRYATTGNLMEPHTWIIIRFFLTHSLVTTLTLLLALLLSFGAYLADRSHRHTQRQEENAYQQVLVTIGESVHHLLEETHQQPQPPVTHNSDLIAPLPTIRSPLIDREQEVEAIRMALMSKEVGLVTLTGPGGVGKTRLAVEVAGEVASQFPDGVAFVSLAALKEPAQLLPTIAHALHVPEESDSTVSENLVKYLRPRHLLLVLDNVERLISAMPLATRTLELAPHLKLLITSREPLQTHDEHTIPIPPLALPNLTHLPDLATLEQIPSVALFVQRAREAKPDFALTEENTHAVAEICQYLDGLPLAIELAAARSRILSPELLLGRLERRLPLLTRGARDLPERQQTLRNTISWSYDLLNEREQELFRRLAVFVGSFTLDAAIAMETGSAGVSEEQDDEELNTVESLVDKNLLRVEQREKEEPHFAMLATIREYALEQLEVHGERATAQQQHASFYLHMAEEVEPYLYKAGRSRWLECLEREDNNLRVALAWCTNDRNAAQTGLRLAGALSRYWFMRGTFHEGRAWLEGLLEQTGNADRNAVRAKALSGAGELAHIAGDYDVASSYTEESLSIWREVGDTWGTGYADKTLGLVRMSQGRIAEARSLFEESHTLFKELGHAWGQTIMLFFLGTADELSGDLATAYMRYEEGLRLFRQQGDETYSLLLLSILAVLVSGRGSKETAHTLYTQVQSLLHRPQSRWELGMFLITNGDYRLHLFGHDQLAKMLYKEGLSLWQDIQHVEEGIGIVKALSGLAEEAATEGRAEQAGWLFGAADTLLPAHSTYRGSFNDQVSRARIRLDTEQFAAGWATGQTMTREQAITRALQET